MKSLRLALLMPFALVGLLAAPAFAQEPEDEPEEQSEPEEADEEPADEEPVEEEPVEEEPVEEEPVEEEPADEEPADEEPADEEPADEEPADEEPADEPAEGPAADQVPDPPAAPPAPPAPSSQANPASEKTCFGSMIVQMVDHAKGFGRLRNESGHEFFFHRSRIRGEVFELLREGQRVDVGCSHGPNPQVDSIRLVEN